MTKRSVLLAATIAAFGAAPVQAQTLTPGALAGTCSGAGGDATSCLVMAVGAQALGGHITQAAALGTQIPGTATTIGRRVGLIPRIALSLQLGYVNGSMPDVRDNTGAGALDFRLPVVRATIGGGLFDGFQLAPTVGGVLSVDAYLQLGAIMLSSSDGFFDRSSVAAVGARVGLLRESFTLPGVSASITKRVVGRTSIGRGIFGGDPIRLNVDPAVTSYRVVVGKNVAGFEFVGGMGWEDYTLDVSYEVPTGPSTVLLSNGSIENRRQSYFLGASTTINLIFTIGVEGGLADSFDPVAGYTGAFDPSARAFFGSLTGRLTV